MSYSLATLWYERQRYLPGVLAVAFSALLIALQCGLLLGLFSITSMPDRPHARRHLDGLAGGAERRPGPADPRELPGSRLASQPEVERPEIYIQGFTYWGKPTAAPSCAWSIGSRLDDDSLGRVDELTPGPARHADRAGRRSSSMSRSWAASASRSRRHGRDHRPARSAWSALIHGCKSLAGPYVFCSLRHGPAAAAPGGRPDDLRAGPLPQPGRRPSGGGAAAGRYPTTSRPSPARSSRCSSRMHWLTKTKAGIALGYAAALGLLVGARGDQPDAVRGHGGVAARVRRAAGPGHSALAAWR